MTLRTYLALLRLGTLWLIAPAVLFGGGIVFHLFAPGHEHRIGAGTFVILIFLGPILLSKVLSQAVQMPMHEPFGITLPNLRRNLLQWHLPLLAILAVTLAAAGHARDRSLPLPVAAGVVFAGLCLMLPREPVGRWFGSHVLSGVVNALYLVAAIFARETRSAMQYAPWLTFVLSLGVAALCCWLGFSRQRLRVRAHTRLLTLGGTFDPEEVKKHGHLALGRSQHTGRAWTRGVVGDSTASWLRVVLHEGYGFSGGWIRWCVKLALILTVFPIGLYLLLTRIPGLLGPPAPIGRMIYQLVWEPHGSVGGAKAIFFTAILAPLYLSVINVALPRPQRLYPISRERRARLAFVASLIQASVQLSAGLSVIVALSWIGARLAGVPFHPTTAPDFLIEMIAFAPFLPALLWRRVCLQVRPWSQAEPATPLWLGCAMGAFYVSVYPASRAWLLSPLGLLVALTATGVSLFLYRRALLNLYRCCDLLQRTSSRTNFSLV